MWRKLILELNGYGLRDTEIAYEAGISTSTISRLRNEITIDPPWSTGEAIINLAKRKRKGRRK